MRKEVKEFSQKESFSKWLSTGRATNGGPGDRETGGTGQGPGDGWIGRLGDKATRRDNKESVHSGLGLRAAAEGRTCEKCEGCEKCERGNQERESMNGGAISL
jgi:hypothetical protein